MEREGDRWREKGVEGGRERGRQVEGGGGGERGGVEGERVSRWRGRRGADRQVLTRIASQVNGVFGLSGGGLWVGVGGGVAAPIHLQTQAVFGFPGQEAVPPAVTQHVTGGAHSHSARPVIDVKHHLQDAQSSVSLSHTHTHTRSPVR